LIRTWRTTDAARHDGAQLPDLIDKQNTASDVWADTAYRSAKNKEHMIRSALRSQIHRKKPQGKPMPDASAKANGKKFKVMDDALDFFVGQSMSMWRGSQRRNRPLAFSTPPFCQEA
jgi:IS5 family transposase